MTTETLLIAAFIGLDAGAVLMALGWLSAKRQEMDQRTCGIATGPRVYKR